MNPDAISVQKPLPQALFYLSTGWKEMKAKQARALSRGNVPTSHSDKPNPWQTWARRFASGCIVVQGFRLGHVGRQRGNTGRFIK